MTCGDQIDEVLNTHTKLDAAARKAKIIAILKRVKLPEPERIFGSLPTTNLNAITIPGLSADLIAVQTAWHNGSLERTQSWIKKWTTRLVGVSAVVLLVGIIVARRRRAR